VTTGQVAPAAGIVRIACVGDSITRGLFVWRRKKRSYPAQLQTMLGEQFRVRDFGVNGHAVQQDSDRPYQSSDEFVLSGAFEPNVVLIMLGTNDSRGDNWKGAAPFEADYRALVSHYRSMPSVSQVWLLTPPALFRLGRSSRVRYGMDAAARRPITAHISWIAAELGCGLVDINRATARHPELFRFDGVHPGGAGATIIAQAVNQALAGAQAGPQG
jgi:beta-galactosidase